MIIVIIVVLITGLGALGFLFVKERARRKQVERKYGPVIDADREAAIIGRQIADVAREHETQMATLVQRRAALNADYTTAYDQYVKLAQELRVLEENLEDISYGIYRPHFHFTDPDGYKIALNQVWEQQKALVRSGRAAVCNTKWSVGGSEREGARMTKQGIKLMLRAFNGECEAAVAKVTWNNVTKMEERIRKSFEAINALGTSNQIQITSEYLEVALSELQLTYEYAARKQEIQEEQRAIREQQREEEKALREAERAKQEAEAEEARYQKALEKVRAEMAKAKGEALADLQVRVQQLDDALDRAREMKDKAVSMAQLTRSGHVYVISNIGPFGENVFKIGMTRRLKPEERVDELGDASVPFPFDIHAMIYSTDAPSLETAFHQKFAMRQVNLTNPRKEFFAVSIDEIEACAREMNVKVELTKLAEAYEFRQTLAKRQQTEMIAAAQANPRTASFASPMTFAQ